MPEPDPKKVLVETLEYVKRLLELGRSPAYQLSDYNHFALLEAEAQGLPGIRYFPDEAEGSAVWMVVERLYPTHAPDLPEILDDWVEASDSVSKTPALKEWRMVSVPKAEASRWVAEGRAKESNVLESPRQEGYCDVRLFSRDDDRLEAALKRYLDEKWHRWSVAERPRRESIDLYKRLFSVTQKISVGELDAPLDVLWGVGQSSWQAEDEQGQVRVISHPLIEFFVELELDNLSQSIRVRPRDALQAKPRLNLEPYEAIGIGGARGLKDFFETEVARLEGEERVLSPEDPESYDPLLRSAAAQLSDAGQYWPDVINDPTDRSVPKPGKDLVVTNTWALFVRKKRPNALAEDIERLQKNAEKIEDMAAGVAFRFAEEPSDERPGGWNVGGWEPDAKGGGGVPLPDEAVDLYFPKPYNDAQKEIVRRLDRASGVVVQGPPGTGKTHTIGNIICHYLALGRRVLVTAKSATALRVLKDQIPEAIQPLVVSLVSSDREGMRQQKEAIETLSGKVVTLQGRERSLYQDIERGEGDIKALERELERIGAEVERLVRKQLDRVKLPFLEQEFENATKLAEWVVEGERRFGWFEDVLGMEDHFEPQFTRSDLERLADVKARIGEDLGLLGKPVPRVEDLPSSKDLARVHRDLIARDEMEATANRGMLLEGLSLEKMQKLEGLAEEFRTLLKWIGETREDRDWGLAIFKAKLVAGQRVPQWYELALELKKEVAALIEERAEFLRRPIDYGTDDDEGLQVIRAAAERASEGLAPLTLLQRFSGENKKLLAGVRIVGRAPNSPSAWKHVVAHYIHKDRCRSLALRWNALAREAPLPRAEEPAGLARIEEEIEFLVSVDDNAKRLKRSWMELIEAFRGSEYRPELTAKVDGLREVIQVLEANIARHRLAASEEARENAIMYLCTFEIEEAKEALELVKRRLGKSSEEEGDVLEAWRRLCLKFEYLRKLQPAFSTVSLLAEKIAKSGAPRWGERLLREVASENERKQLKDGWEAWKWARAKAMFRAGDAQAALEGWEERRHETEARLRSTLESLVQRKTYLALCATMSDRAKSSLAQFLAAMANIGTGTGKKAPFYRMAAQKAMHGCAGAIPCWIMPSWRASEVLPSEIGYFDLVIVDEASQCDIRELPALARGKKVLVVGDNKQVSPTVVGLDFNRVLQLRHNYLRNQPFANLMLPESSLYDLASSVFAGGQILLNEHFRCVEPIIRFSFQFYRKDAIKPVRLPKAAERIDPPLVGVYLKNGYREGKLNRPEAEAIVDEIERLVKEPEFERRTIGVISMVGDKQAQLIESMLLDRIGQTRFLQHDMVCGDSATFQGREKDIIFISLVVAPGQRKVVKVTSRMWEQRFNVAASRARDRMYVYHSVRKEDLSEDDLKARLLAHLQDPMPAKHEPEKDLIELCESPFEKEFFAKLEGMGYCVTPQVPCAGRRIDLVVEGEIDARLAIELDGDSHHGPEVWLEDWLRQKVLERVGWRFWRCWYSSYIADPKKCFELLFARLEREGIRPTKGKAVARRYSEFRTVGEGAPEAAAHESEVEPSREEVVEVGDTVVVTQGDPKDGYMTIRIVEGAGDPDNHVYGQKHAVAQALLGQVVEDEVDLEVAGKVQRVCIVRLEKATPVSGQEAVREELDKSAISKPSKGDFEDVNRPALKKADPSVRPPASLDEVLGRRSSESNDSGYGRRQADDRVESSRDAFDGKVTSQQAELAGDGFALAGMAEASGGYGRAEPAFPDPSEADDESIADCLEVVVSKFGPMYARHALSEYIRRSPISKLGRLVQDKLMRVLLNMLEDGRLKLVPKMAQGDPGETVIKMADQDDFVVRPNLERDLDVIPTNELREVFRRTVSIYPTLEKEGLMRAVLEFYGKKKLTNKADRILGELANEALRQKG